ncbi:MAG: hypothetical protein DMF63_12725 [Acidobacteria bacterium]|nr:MAG: hypothetical protein DMF63_12725 [Acidobacteriota bacterium]
MPEQQTYGNHVRYFPLFHFVLTPLLALNFIYQAVRLYQEPSLDRAVFTILSLGFVGMILAARLQALKAQDRVIRLEERLRYRELLPPDLAGRASDLSFGQIVALRFAHDDELADLLRRTCDGEFAASKDIKLAIKNWRGDYHRV